MFWWELFKFWQINPFLCSSWHFSLSFFFFLSISFNYLRSSFAFLQIIESYDLFWLQKWTQKTGKMSFISISREKKGNKPNFGENRVPIRFGFNKNHKSHSELHSGSGMQFCAIFQQRILSQNRAPAWKEPFYDWHGEFFPIPISIRLIFRMFLSVCVRFFRFFYLTWLCLNVFLPSLTIPNTRNTPRSFSF